MYLGYVTCEMVCEYGLPYSYTRFNSLHVELEDACGYVEQGIPEMSRRISMAELLRNRAVAVGPLGEVHGLRAVVAIPAVLHHIHRQVKFGCRHTWATCIFVLRCGLQRCTTRLGGRG